MGAVCHTLNPRLTAKNLGVMLAQSEARILLASPDLLPLAQAASMEGSAVEHILLLDDRGAAVTGSGEGLCNIGSLESAMAAESPDIEWGRFDEHAPSGLCFTSGTTGAPKGVTYTHRGCYLHTMRQLSADVMGVRAEDAVLAVVPMFHANAWGLPFTVPAVGGKLVLPGRHSEGAHLAALIRSEGVTLGVGVPTVSLGLVEHLESEGGDLPSLERILVGGASMRRR